MTGNELVTVGPARQLVDTAIFINYMPLDKRLKGLDGPTKASVLAAMESQIIAQTQLVGTYQKNN